MEQCVYAIRLIHGEDLLCLGSGERAGDMFRIGLMKPLAPSGQWKVTGLVQPWGFGTRALIPLDLWHTVEMTRLAGDYRPGDFWTYKNGKPKWTACDLDHGTRRRWGTPSVRKVSRWPVASVVDNVKWELNAIPSTQLTPFGKAEATRHLQAIGAFLDRYGV